MNSFSCGFLVNELSLRVYFSAAYSVMGYERTTIACSLLGVLVSFQTSLSVTLLASIYELFTEVTIYYRCSGTNTSLNPKLNSLLVYILVIPDQDLQWPIPLYLTGQLLSSYHFHSISSASFTTQSGPYHGIPLLA